MIARRPRALGVAVALVLAACGRAGAPQGDARSGDIRLGVLSTRSEGATRDAWGPIVADVADRTGLHVMLRIYPSDAAMIYAWKTRAVDVGVFSNLAALDLMRRGDAEVFARTALAGDMTDRVSVLVASGKRSFTLNRVLACKRNLSLAMGDRLSTGGALAPMTYLFAPRDIDPATCFKQVRIDTDPMSELDAVDAGQLDLALMSSTALARGLQSREKAVKNIAVLWRSPPLPQDPVLWRRTLDPIAKEGLRQFFITYGQGAGDAATKARGRLARIDVGGFRPADESYLLPVREMEATMAWYAAKRTHDAPRIEEARASLDAISAQRFALEARTRAPAAAQ